jgi:excisionase family DNA binding protein
VSVSSRRVRYQEAADYIGVPVGTLRSLVSRRKVPHIKIGPQTVLFDLDAIDVWIAEHSISPGGER